MLKSDLEIRKGILFVRLTGILSKNTVNNLKKVINLISNNGLNNVVINIEKLDYIDNIGINIFNYICKLCQKNNGKLLLCGTRKVDDLDITFTSSELDAFKIIKI